MLGVLMQARTVSLILALVLLFTQQLGLRHLLSHGLVGTAAAAQSAAALGLPGADAGHGAEAPAGDGLCQACLVLATLGMATLPGVLRWLAPRQLATAPAAPARRAFSVRRSAPYLARAPPALRH